MSKLFESKLESTRRVHSSIDGGGGRGVSEKNLSSFGIKTEVRLFLLE